VIMKGVARITALLIEDSISKAFGPDPLAG
jgi:hypothetical protein